MNPDFLPTTPEGRCWRLAEECAEVIKELAKAGRFGLDTVAPNNCPEVGTTPRERILSELTDLKHAIEAIERDLCTVDKTGV